MVDGAAVRIAELLRPVILHQGRSMILVHNHPSGSPEPSRADQLLTAELVQAAETMAIDMIDHIIVTRDNFESMLNMGVLPTNRSGHQTTKSNRRESSKRKSTKRKRASRTGDA